MALGLASRLGRGDGSPSRQGPNRPAPAPRSDSLPGERAAQLASVGPACRIAGRNWSQIADSAIKRPLPPRPTIVQDRTGRGGIPHDDPSAIRGLAQTDQRRFRHPSTLRPRARNARRGRLPATGVASRAGSDSRS